MDGNYKQKLGDILSLIIQDAGVMQKIHNENVPEIVRSKTPFLKSARKEGIDITNIDTNVLYEKYCENLVGKKKLGLERLWLENYFH